MQNIVEGYQGETLRRWEKFMRSEPLSKIRKLPLVHTHGEHFLEVFRHPKAGVSTNKFLRILHNRALDLGWLLNPVLPKRAWPKFRYQSRRGITLLEHQKLVEAEHDPEYKLYYQFLWETGGSQTDIAGLHWSNIDREQRHLSYERKKLEGRGFCGAALVIGESLQRILDQLPQEGWLFPSIRIRREVDRASRFRKVRIRAGVEDVTLHGYRYAWAERAMSAGMPEREAMAHLGHNSRAIHQAYARKANVLTMPLEHYEKIKAEKVIEFRQVA